MDIYNNPTDDQQTNILHHRFTLGSGVIVSLLFVTLLALFERILYDVARVFVNPNPDYFNYLGVIVSHAIIIIPLLAISVVLNTMLGAKKQKYAIAVIPYFVLSAFLTVQLAFQIMWYFSNHHTNFEFYSMTLVVIIALSCAIYFLQKKFHPAGTV